MITLDALSYSIGLALFLFGCVLEVGFVVLMGVVCGLCGLLITIRKMKGDEYANG